MKWKFLFFGERSLIGYNVIIEFKHGRCSMLTKSNNIRSAKRGKNERQGVHRWHPYYAGYSENFVEDMLDYMGANEDSIVFDPWMGSGTTALVCQKRGIECWGTEINPVMVLFAKSKTTKILDFNIEELLNIVLEQEQPTSDISSNSYGNEEAIQFLSNDYLEALNKLRFSIDNTTSHLQKSVNDEELIEAIKSFFYAGLFRTLRSVGNFKKGKNPTWLVKEVPALLNEHVNVSELFEQFIKSMINDLQDAYSLNRLFDAPVPKVELGDSRDLDKDDNSVDYIITSPPYLTRIDYAVSTKPELLFLGYKEKDEFNHVRRKTMGAPVICDKTIKVNKGWGELCQTFINKVANHDTKAAKSYYLPIFLQYFKDAYSSICEIKRVLKPGGQACLVVQSSYFKDVEARLGDMYVEMGQLLGMDAEIVMRDEIKQHIAHVNTKSSQYVKNKVYYEDAVVFKKRGEQLGEYSSHREQVSLVEGLEDRARDLEDALLDAFRGHIFTKEVAFINFANMNAEELAKAFKTYPIIVKSILASVNVAGRAVKRDLEISLDTYKGILKEDQAAILAGYIKPMLPDELAIPAICELDRWFFVDKEIRKHKGNWEKAILSALNENSKELFKKRKFNYGNEKYELDAAAPIEGDIKIGIDIKRIEAKQDIHKRADEIINKAVKFKKVYPTSKFYALVYYPFPSDHLGLQTRLKDENIDGIYFAGETYSYVEQQVKYILGDSQLLKDVLEN